MDGKENEVDRRKGNPVLTSCQNDPLSDNLTIPENCSISPEKPLLTQTTPDKRTIDIEESADSFRFSILVSSIW